MRFRLLIAVSFAITLCAQNLRISGERIRAHVKYLASDELEGRGVGTRGAELATAYIAAQLQAEGVKPGGDNGTYFQRVPLIGCTTLPSATLTIAGKNRRIPLHFVKDYVGTALSQQPRNDFN